MMITTLSWKMSPITMIHGEIDRNSLELRQVCDSYDSFQNPKKNQVVILCNGDFMGIRDLMRFYADFMGMYCTGIQPTTMGYNDN